MTHPNVHISIQFYWLLAYTFFKHQFSTKFNYKDNLQLFFFQFHILQSYPDKLSLLFFRFMKLALLDSLTRWSRKGPIGFFSNSCFKMVDLEILALFQPISLKWLKIWHCNLICFIYAFLLLIVLIQPCNLKKINGLMSISIFLSVTKRSSIVAAVVAAQ